MHGPNFVSYMWEEPEIEKP